MTQQVLIVDDSKLARMGVIRVLKTLHPDWESMEASNADDAVALVRESTPDFVLMDYNMPGKDGITLAAELRALDTHMQVAVISANQQVEVVDRARAAGATFLPKPITEKALAEFFAAARKRNAADK
ncbi:MAG TPA: response regulator transcription factor [Pseudomonadales bacterium]